MQWLLKSGPRLKQRRGDAAGRRRGGGGAVLEGGVVLAAIPAIASPLSGRSLISLQVAVSLVAAFPGSRSRGR
jgi:hypothetical protein